MENPYLDVRQLGQIFGKSHHTIREYAAKFNLKTKIVDGKMYLRKLDVKKIVEKGRNYFRI